MTMRLAHDDLLFTSFNQDNGCFAVGTDRGFRIYNCDPYRLTFQREFRSGGIGIVQMLFRSNLLALVGGGKSPRFPPNKVIIWDDQQNRGIGELTFRTEVRAVRMRRDVIVAVLDNKTYVYMLSDLQLRHEYETCDNPLGLVALSSDPGTMVLAVPGIEKGYVQWEVYGRQVHPTVKAAESALAAMELSRDGTRLATASEKGTLVRIFDTATGQRLRELRRGWDRAVIHSLSFSERAEWLAVSSDKGTVHVYAVGGGAIDAQERLRSAGGGAPGGGEQGRGDGHGGGDASGSAANQKSSLAFMSSMLPKYFSSEWSFAQFRVPDEKTICAFGDGLSNHLVVLGARGAFYKVSFDQRRGGDCKVEFSADFSARQEEEAL